MKPITIAQFFKMFSCEDDCLRHLFEVRFGFEHTCCKCQKPARFSRLKNVKAFSCNHCGDHVHPMAGTMFEGSTTPLNMWFYVVYMFTLTRNGVSAKEIQRATGVTYKTAWRMGHKIREHMGTVDGDSILGGIGEIVQVDEVYLGGKVKQSQGTMSNKITVQGMLQNDGELVTEVIPKDHYSRNRALADTVVENIAKGTEIHTDEHNAYKRLGKIGYDHKAIQHSKKEWAEYEADGGVVTTNAIEGYFSQLRRTVEGTHVHISEQHAEKYIKESEYRYNRRNSASKMLPELLSTFPVK